MSDGWFVGGIGTAPTDQGRNNPACGPIFPGPDQSQWGAAASAATGAIVSGPGPRRSNTPRGPGAYQGTTPLKQLSATVCDPAGESPTAEPRQSTSRVAPQDMRRSDDHGGFALLVRGRARWRQSRHGWLGADGTGLLRFSAGFAAPAFACACRHAHAAFEEIGRAHV